MDGLRPAAVLVLAGILLAACSPGPGERACGLLDDLPAEVTEVTLEDVDELARAAMDSERPEIRDIGEQIASTVRVRQGLENLAPGAAADVLNDQLQRLREACQSL